MSGLDEPFTLKHTNVSTPHLEQSSDKQSVTAEEEYHSARASTRGSESPRRLSTDSVENPFADHNNRYSTPPDSPTLHPTQGHWPLYNPQTVASSSRNDAQGTGISSVNARQPTNPKETVRLVDGHTIRRKPVGSPRGSTSGQMDVNPRSPTPGEDDSPFIRFAVDQLTRDEEVRGSRQYAYPSGGSGTAVSAYRGQSMATDTTPPRSNILEAPEHPHESAPAYVESDPFASPNTTEDRAVSSETRTRNVAPGPQESSNPANDGLEIESARDNAFPPRASSRYPSTQPGQTPATQPTEQIASPAQHSVFVPFDQDVSTVGLRFVPKIIRPSLLLVYIFLLVLMLAGLIFSGVWSGTMIGLFEYEAFGDGRYFLFEYLPTMCAVFLQFWLFQIQAAVQRMAPFIAMSSLSVKSRSQAPLLEVFPTSFLTPKLFYFRAGLPVIGVCMMIFWIQIVNVPLMTCLYNVYFYGSDGSGSWRWTAVQGVVWTLFALYLLQFVAVVGLLIFLAKRRTGLDWDFRALVDAIPLIARSNITPHYNNTELFESPRQFQQHLAQRSDRLGYWQTSARPNTTFYAIGEEGGDTRRYSIEHGRLSEKVRPLNAGKIETHAPNVDLEQAEEFERVRYRYLPWYLRPTYLLLWCIAAILLYVAFLVVSYVNDAVLHGFSPLTNVDPTPAGFSATNFTYSFIPALIAQFLSLAWLTVDYAFRRLQPYAALSGNKNDGVMSSSSLLLDYPARLPGSITLAAFANRDIRMMWFTTLSLIAATLPILAGGCFWAQFYVDAQEVRVAVDPPAYYALCTFLALYALTLPLCFVGLRKRRLPHPVTTLAEIFSFFYTSGLLSERVWHDNAHVASKKDVANMLLGGRDPGESKFSFGRFIARDGRMHLGVHRVEDNRDEGVPETWHSEKPRDRNSGSDPNPRRSDYSTMGGVPFIPPKSSARSRPQSQERPKRKRDDTTEEGEQSRVAQAQRMDEFRQERKLSPVPPPLAQSSHPTPPQRVYTRAPFTNGSFRGNADFTRKVDDGMRVQRERERQMIEEAEEFDAGAGPQKDTEYV